jgi:hypothetical protein
MADAESVVLMSREKISDGAGGHTWSPAPRPSQDARLIPKQPGAERLNSEGVLVIPEFVLVGLYGTVIERYDRFTLGGRNYEVVWVHENQEYQTKAEVVNLD